MNSFDVGQTSTLLGPARDVAVAAPLSALPPPLNSRHAAERMNQVPDMFADMPYAAAAVYTGDVADTSAAVVRAVAVSPKSPAPVTDTGADAIADTGADTHEAPSAPVSTKKPSNRRRATTKSSASRRAEPDAALSRVAPFDTNSRDGLAPDSGDRAAPASRKRNRAKRADAKDIPSVTDVFDATWRSDHADEDDCEGPAKRADTLEGETGYEDFDVRQLSPLNSTAPAPSRVSPPVAVERVGAPLTGQRRIRLSYQTVASFVPTPIAVTSRDIDALFSLLEHNLDVNGLAAHVMICLASLQRNSVGFDLDSAARSNLFTVLGSIASE